MNPVPVWEHCEHTAVVHLVDFINIDVDRRGPSVIDRGEVVHHRRLDTAFIRRRDVGMRMLTATIARYHHRNDRYRQIYA